MIPVFKNIQTQLIFCDILQKENRVVKRTEVPQDVYEELLEFDKNYFEIYKRHSSLKFE